MKKSIFLLTILGFAILTFGFTSQAAAQSLDPVFPGGNENGLRRSGSAGIGDGTPIDMNINLDGLLDPLIHDNMAEALGISLDVFEARVAAGETFSDIALSLGFDLTIINEMLDQIRIDTYAQAVIDALITQEIADWLIAHGNNSFTNGDGICTGDDTIDCTPQNTGTAQIKGKRNGQN